MLTAEGNINKNNNNEEPTMYDHTVDRDYVQDRARVHRLEPVSRPTSPVRRKGC